MGSANPLEQQQQWLAHAKQAGVGWHIKSLAPPTQRASDAAAAEIYSARCDAAWRARASVDAASSERKAKHQPAHDTMLERPRCVLAVVVCCIAVVVCRLCALLFPPHSFGNSKTSVKRWVSHMASERGSVSTLLLPTCFLCKCFDFPTFACLCVACCTLMIFRLSISGCLTDFGLIDCLFAQLERLNSDYCCCCCCLYAIIRLLISGSSTQQLPVFSLLLPFVPLVVVRRLDARFRVPALMMPG